jgi:hypothetical protein
MRQRSPHVQPKRNSATAVLVRLEVHRHVHWSPVLYSNTTLCSSKSYKPHSCLVDEVHAEEVQNHAPKHIIRKRPVLLSESPVSSPRCFTYLSCDIFSKSALLSAFVCILKLAVSTNCPTVAEKPDRKALKGWTPCQLLISPPNTLDSGSRYFGTLT